jgi:hypothetical protein
VDRLHPVVVTAMGVWTDGDNFYDDNDNDVTSDVVDHFFGKLGRDRSFSLFFNHPERAARRYNRAHDDQPRQRGFFSFW